MRAVALMYHDVIENGDFGASGFPGAGADIYKLDVAKFERHLSAIERRYTGPVRTVDDLQHDVGDGLPLVLTFDDGGRSAYTHIAESLTKRQWRGHFFMTTNQIGAPTFLDDHQIRQLVDQGHCVGSHSHSHPPRMAQLSFEDLVDEWRTSTKILADILGRPVKHASVPGGFFSRAVAEAAGEAGIEVLFTSEPVVQSYSVNGCRVMGRYIIAQGVSPETAARLAVHRTGPALRQWGLWNARKIAKKIGGKHYLALRKTILNR